MKTSAHHRLNLRAGELVEIRSKEEILATLDSSGRLDQLPFMPEMLAYAGRRVRVASRADKTCDTVSSSGLRRLRDTVHLQDLRCNGTCHGGCQAECLIFWKEAWLRRVTADEPAAAPARAGCSEQQLTATAQAGEDAWSCQATNLLRYTEPLRWWDLRQYARDYLSGNVTLWAVLRGWFYFVFRKTIRIKGYRLQLRIFNAIQRARGSMPFPEFEGALTKTPADRLNLQPGELVRIKDVEEIRETLNKESLNRGLTFDVEMALHCGSAFRVRSRVTQIINERTGKMMKLPGDCIVLDGAVCKAHYHQNCPRAIFPYWREVWLQRLQEPVTSAQQEEETTQASC